MVKIITRQMGDRRWNLPCDFPVVDSEGVLVMHDRRRLPDRRRSLDDFQDLIVTLSRLTRRDAD